MEDNNPTRGTFTFSHLGSVNIYYVDSEQSEAPPLKPPQDAVDLKAELGMPQSAVWRRLTAGGNIVGDHWRDYRLLLFGMLVDSSEEAGLFWHIKDRAGNVIENIQLWYQRVCHIHSPVCCELRWHPEKGESITFTGLENAQKERDIILAWRGKALLQKVARQGRPANSFNLSEAEFIERAPKVFGEWVATFGEEPTDVELAEELGISRATFYRYLKSYNLTIQQIRAKSRGDSY